MNRRLTTQFFSNTPIVPPSPYDGASLAISLRDLGFNSVDKVVSLFNGSTVKWFNFDEITNGTLLNFANQTNGDAYLFEIKNQVDGEIFKQTNHQSVPSINNVAGIVYKGGLNNINGIPAFFLGDVEIFLNSERNYKTYFAVIERKNQNVMAGHLTRTRTGLNGLFAYASTELYFFFYPENGKTGMGVANNNKAYGFGDNVNVHEKSMLYYNFTGSNWEVGKNNNPLISINTGNFPIDIIGSSQRSNYTGGLNGYLGEIVAFSDNKTRGQIIPHAQNHYGL